MIRNAKANALNRRKSLVKRNEEVLISYPADADRVLMDNSDDLSKEESVALVPPASDRAAAGWRNISRNRNALISAEKSCTSRAFPSWWPVYRWNLAYKNPFFLPALTAHACTRIKSMSHPLTVDGLERKEKDILRSVCSRWDIDDPSSLDKVGANLRAAILETVQVELEAFKQKLTNTLLDNSIEARQQIRACLLYTSPSPRDA